MRAYCQTHKETYSVEMSSLIVCERGMHTLGSAPNTVNGPDLWEYCCECQTFWLTAAGAACNPKCLVCDREAATRYLCDNCQTLTIQAASASSVREFFISPKGIPQPHCPGCAGIQNKSVVNHKCRTYGASLTSARIKCPFCQQQIATPSPQNPSPGSHPASARESSLFAQTDSQFRFRPKHAVLLSVAAVGVLLLIPSLILLVVFARQNDSPNPNITSGNTSRPYTMSVPPGMVYVSGGVFIMGDDAGDEYESPAHSVTVKPFFIDTYEVTSAKYAEFIRATNRVAPVGWNSGTFPPGTGNRPVTGVNWYDAQAYAEWAGKRLPTEQEWEFAARGTDGRRYTWGDAWRSRAANAGDSTAGRLVDVGLYPEGKSPFGAFDMIGNALEWTASDLRPYPGAQIPDFPVGPRKIIRGGSWVEADPPDWSTTFRGFALPSGGSGYSLIGFRCAKDAPPNSSVVEKVK